MTRERLSHCGEERRGGDRLAERTHLPCFKMRQVRPAAWVLHILNVGFLAKNTLEGSR